VGGFFLLKFSIEMLIRTMNGTLTHNGLNMWRFFYAIYLVLALVRIN